MAKVINFTPPTIPLARDVLDGNRIIRASEAIYPCHENRYKCLDENCKSYLQVVTRDRKKHFRHQPGQATDNCGFSRKLFKTGRRHHAALHLLAAVFREAIHFRMPTPVIAVQHAGVVSFTTICINYRYVQGEWTCPDTKRKADIALLDKYRDPVLIIEIYHTHAVDHNKRSDYSDKKWIEVTANDVINDYERLILRQQGNFLHPIFDPNMCQLQLPGMTRSAW